MSSTANRIVKNTGFLYMKSFITMFISLWITRLILNSLGASDFGIYNIVGGAIGMLGFLNGAMASATQRFMSYSEGAGDKDKETTIFNISLILHVALGLFMVLVLTVAGFFFFNGILNIEPDRIYAAKVVYGCFIVSTMLTIMNSPYDAVMNAHENMKYYAIIGIFESLLKLGVAFACVYTSHDKLIVYGILMAAIPLVTLTIMKIYCHRNYVECVIAPRKHFSKAMMKEMTGFAGWNLLGSSSSMLGNYGNGLVINHFFGTVINAAMGVANQLNGMLLVFSNQLMKALNPVIVKSEGANNRQNMLKYSYIGCKYPFFLLAVISIPCLLEMPYILKLWLKNPPLWSVLFVRLQVIRTLLEMLVGGLRSSLSAIGNIKESNIWSVFYYLFPLVVLWFLFVAGFPPYWVYITSIVFMVFVGSAVTIYYCVKYCGLKVSEYLKEVVYPATAVFAASIIIGFLPQLFVSEGFLRLLICALLSFSSFALAVYFTLKASERQMVFSIKNRILHYVKQ